MQCFSFVIPKLRLWLDKVKLRKDNPTTYATNSVKYFPLPIERLLDGNLLLPGYMSIGKPKTANRVGVAALLQSVKQINGPFLSPVPFPSY